MEQVRSNDWIRHIPKVLRAGAVLAIIGIILPSAGAMESYYSYSISFFFWYFGFWWGALDGNQESGWIGELFSGTNAVTIGIAAVVILIITFIFLNIGANNLKDQRNIKLAAGTSTIGGILAFIGPAVYYYGMDNEIPGFFGPGGFDASFGIYLPIIGGILGIIGGIAAGYAFSLESKGELRQKIPYQPIQDKMVIDKVSGVRNQLDRPIFCKNCGAKLLGPFCQDCGTKAEF